MESTMKAVVAEDFGTPALWRLTKVPVPRPAAGEVQVRVAATGLNPSDVRMYNGDLRDLVPMAFPATPGSDFAGAVTEVGEGVTRFRPGDQVFGFTFPASIAEIAARVTDPPSLGTGALAQYMVLTADSPGLVHRPAELSPVRAAALPSVGVTAASVMRQGDFRPGETVLVIGAAGGVGSALVPLLAEAKAHVIATALPADETVVRQWGATETLDYSTVDTVAETLRRHPAGVDAIANLAVPGEALVAASQVLRPGGRVVTAAFGSPQPEDFTRSDITFDMVFGAAEHGDLAALADKAVAGILPDPVSKKYSMDSAIQAGLDLTGRHTRGKLVVLPNG